MKLLMQAIHFVGISGVGWILDFCTFNALHLKVESVMLCNMISSIVGVVFVFAVSTRKTFVQKENGMNLKVKFLIYVAYQIILIFTMSKILSSINLTLQNILAQSDFLKFTAMFSKILVTPITMALNFCVMKLLVEKI